MMKKNPRQPISPQADEGQSQQPTGEPFMKQLPTSYFSSREDCLMSLLHLYCNEVKKCPQQPRPMGGWPEPLPADFFNSQQPTGNF